jgi:hypothetical protein
MIAINLLPEELKSSRPGQAGLGRWRALVPWLAIILLSGHLLFGAIYLVRGLQLVALSASWERLAPQRKRKLRYSRYFLIS